MRSNKLQIIFLLLFGIGFFYTTSKSQVDWNSINIRVQQQTFRITGKVLDQNNLSVADVRVYAMINDRPAKARAFMSFTDRNGYYSLGLTLPGSYNVYTAKESEGYTDTFLADILTSNIPPQVVIDESHPEATVEVKRGPKAPRLKGKVVDSEMGKQTTDARLKFCPVEKPDLCFSTSIYQDGSFDLLVPFKPITITASSPRYRDDEALSLKSSETQELTVSLGAN